MILNLFNTLGRKLEVFKPLKDKQVGLYSCGPTIYWYMHIGNLRSYIFSDVLKRTLLYDGFEVKHVMNYTDVGHLTSDADEGDDKIEVAAEKEHKTAKEISNYNSFDALILEGTGFGHFPINKIDNFTKENEKIYGEIKRLAKKKQLSVYVHDGFWHSMDTYPDVDNLNKMWSSEPEWKIWKD